MPDTKAPAVVPAAEVAAVPAQPSDGATPPIAESPAPQDSKQTKYEQAVAALNAAGDIRQPEEGSGDVIGKMMGEQPSVMDRLAEASRDPLAQDETPVEESTETVPVDPAAEVALVDETTPAVELTDERVRTNINRKKTDGSFVHSERTRAALTLSHDEQIDYEEAYTRLFGERKEPASEKPAEAAPAKSEPTAAEIDAQIKDLQAQRKKARASIDDDREVELTDKIEGLIAERQDALSRDWQRQQTQKETQSTVEQQIDASVGRAEALYPDAAKTGTALHGAITAEIARLQKAGSALLSDPEWPETVAAKVASRLGIAPKVAAPKAAAAKPAAAAVPVRKATPVPSPGSVSGPAPQVSRVDSLRQRMIDAKAKGDWNALQALGAEIGAPA